MTIHADPHVTSHPQGNLNVKYGESTTLCVSAIGSGELYYKWKKNGQDITDPNCTEIETASLTITSFSEQNQGKYMCEIKNALKTVESHSVKLELSKYR